MKREFQQKGVTIVSISEDIDSPAKVGVTKFGGNKGEPFRPNVGLDTASNRAQIQPWTTIPDNKKSTFDLTCNIIMNHIASQKQISLKNLKVNRKKSDNNAA